MNLKTLDALYASLSLWTWSGCNGLGYHLQHSEKHARPYDTYDQLIEFFLLQVKILFLLFEILDFLQYCVTKNWGDILGIKCICQLTFIFCFWKCRVTFWIWSWTSHEICQTYTLITIPSWRPFKNWLLGIILYALKEVEGR